MHDDEHVEDAVVLPGGGAHCAFQVGVLSALTKEACCPGSPTGRLDPQIVSGSSLGALNAAILSSGLQQGAQAGVDYLEATWRERIARNTGDCSNGIFRVRFDATPYFDPRCLLRHPLQPLIDFGGDFSFLAYDMLRRAGNFIQSRATWQMRMLEVPDLSDYICTSPLRRLLRDTVDLEKIRHSQRKFLITATDWKRGRAEVFHNQDMDEQNGYSAIIASAALPGILAPVNIGPELFIDGSTAMNTPLFPTINARRESTRHLNIHIVYVDPTLDEIPFPEMPGALSNFYRLTVIFLARTLTTDIEAVRRISRKLEGQHDAGRKGNGRASDLPDEARRVLQTFHGRPSPGLRITIHRYRPPQPLGGLTGMMDFRAPKIARLIEIGKNAGRTHNCAEAGCETVDIPASAGIASQTDTRTNKGYDHAAR